MTHILDTAFTQSESTNQAIPASLLSVSADQPARMSFRTGRSTSTIQTERPTRPSTPEARLWAGVLLGLYREIALGGPDCPAARELRDEGQEELESIASQLGMPRGFVERLVERATETWEARKRKRGLGRAIHLVGAA